MSEVKREMPTADRPANNPDYPNLKVKEKAMVSPEEMQQKIDLYFQELKDNKKEQMSASGQIKEVADPLVGTIESVSAYLGFKTVKSFYNYGEAEGYEDYHDVVQYARAKILGQKSLALVNGKGSATGLIFDLVNNHGYKNKSEVESDNKNETRIIVEYE